MRRKYQNPFPASNSLRVDKQKQMRSFLIFTFICLFSIFASGQERKDAAFLRLSFEIKDSNFCFGDSTEIVAKLTNTNKNPVVIDVNRIGYVKYFDRYYRKTKQDLYGSFGLAHALSSPYKPNFITLQPKEFYNKHLKVVFDPEYFTKGGRYQMQIGYEQSLEGKFENLDVWGGIVNSNKILISVKKCA